MNTPNRKQFAQVVADAYFSQYCDDEGRSGKVMNNPAIVYDYDLNEFSWQSSLTPRNEDEIVVSKIEHGLFGDVMKDEMIYNRQEEDDLITYLTDGADDYWDHVMEIIDREDPNPSYKKMMERGEYAIRNLSMSTGDFGDNLDYLYDAVAHLCQTETYELGKANLLEWLFERNYSGDETPEKLAREWDELELAF